MEGFTFGRSTTRWKALHLGEVLRDGRLYIGARYYAMEGFTFCGDEITSI